MKPPLRKCGGKQSSLQGTQAFLSELVVRGDEKSRLTCCRFKYCFSILSRQHISLLPAPGLSCSEAFTLGIALLSCHSGGKRKTMACSIMSFHEIRKISVRQEGRK